MSVLKKATFAASWLFDVAALPALQDVGAENLPGAEEEEDEERLINALKAGPSRTETRALHLAARLEASLLTGDFEAYFKALLLATRSKTRPTKSHPSSLQLHHPHPELELMQLFWLFSRK